MPLAQSKLSGQPVAARRPFASMDLYAPALGLLSRPPLDPSHSCLESKSLMTEQAADFHPYCDVCLASLTFVQDRPDALQRCVVYCNQCNKYLCDDHREQHLRLHGDHIVTPHLSYDSQPRNDHSPSSNLSSSSAHYLEYAKCRYHPNTPTTLINMSKMWSACHECRGKEPTYDYLTFTEAAPVLRQAISDALLIPLSRKVDRLPSEEEKPLLVNTTNDRHTSISGEVSSIVPSESMRTSLGETTPPQNLLQTTITMLSTSETFLSLKARLFSLLPHMNKMKQAAERKCAVLYNMSDDIERVCEGKSAEHTLILLLESLIGSVMKLIRSIDGLVIQRECIVRTLLIAMDIVGIINCPSNENNKAIDEINMLVAEVLPHKANNQSLNSTETLLQKLNRRPVDGTSMGQEVLALLTIGCLRETIEFGDPLLMALDNSAIKGILAEREGLLDRVSIVEKMFRHETNRATMGGTPPSTLASNRVYAMSSSGMTDVDVCSSSSIVESDKDVQYRAYVYDCLYSLKERLNEASSPDYWLLTLRLYRQEKAKERGRTLFKKACRLVATSYDERKPVTGKAVKLVDEALSLGNPNALVLRGIQLTTDVSTKHTYSLFKDAEEQGADDPWLWLYLARTTPDVSEWVMYMEKLVAGKPLVINL